MFNDGKEIPDFLDVSSDENEKPKKMQNKDNNNKEVQNNENIKKDYSPKRRKNNHYDDEDSYSKNKHYHHHHNYYNHHRKKYYSRSSSKSHEKSRSRSNKNSLNKKNSPEKKITNNDKEKPKEVKKYDNVNKWSDNTSKIKDEFTSIKIQKYDKNKKNNNKENNKKDPENEINNLKKNLNEEQDSKEIIKEKPNFEPSGILTKDLFSQKNTNDKNNILKYTPPQDKCIPPTDTWFLFKFIEKNEEPIETYKLIGKDFFLVGKDNRICDVIIKNKNISRQHAVIQFREKKKKNKDGDIENVITPYIIDLCSTNGTYLNDEKIENSKYYELLDKDKLVFGEKGMEFVIMKTNE